MTEQLFGEEGVYGPVAMAWLYWRSDGGLLLVMVMHASVNNTAGVVPAALPSAADPFAVRGSSVAWTPVAVSWAVAAVLLHQMRHEHKSEHSPMHRADAYSDLSATSGSTFVARRAGT